MNTAMATTVERAFLIKGPMQSGGAIKKATAVLFASEQPKLSTLAEAGFVNRRFFPLTVDTVTLGQGSRLKGIHTTPTMYVFDQPSDTRNVAVATKADGWQMRKCNGSFVHILPMVSELAAGKKAN